MRQGRDPITVSTVELVSSVQREIKKVGPVVPAGERVGVCRGVVSELSNLILHLLPVKNGQEVILLV